MAEFEQNLWAPWRMSYIAGLSTKCDDACFLCCYRESAADDAANFVLWRTARTLVLLNRFPYTTGHVLVAPLAHVAEPELLPDETFVELARRTRDAKRVLATALGPQGFNIGMNLGRCAGAGLPDHLHWHIVPRWNGDTNFMPAVGGVRVIPESLEVVRDKFLEHAAVLGL